MPLDHLPDFLWAGGIEDTFIAHATRRFRALDEYELMGHYEHWREDLALSRDLGLRALRWGVPWYRVEPERGRFEWRWTDEVIPYMVQELGILPIIDLMHYGCPLWMPKAFDSDDYPHAVAAYAGAFAERYGSLVRWYTPLNEPAMTALMCGRRALWPPYFRGDRGYIRVMLQAARGIVRTVEAIKMHVPDAVMVHVEATGLTRAAEEDLEELAAEEQERRYLSFDLVAGRITRDHRLFPWLLRHGARLGELQEMARSGIDLDVIGLNFYPQWSTRQLYINRTGRLGNRPSDKEGPGFATLIHEHHNRYGVPLMVTETSAYGSQEIRLRWLDASLATVKAARTRGVPLIGYTWFPLFTMVDWGYRFGTAPVERYHIELGLYTLDGQKGRARWNPTPLAECMRTYIGRTEDVVGTIGPLGNQLAATC